MDIAVVGVGNILMSDEGVGVRVIEELRKLDCVSEQVTLIDGGTTGLDLVPMLAGFHRVIIVDAVSGDQEPGAIYVFAREQIKQYYQSKVSLHEVGIYEIFNVLAMLGKAVHEVVIVGIQPQFITVGLELSPSVQRQLSHAVKRVCGLLADWGVSVNTCTEDITLED